MTKTEADKEEDRRTLGSSKATALLQLVATPEWRWRNLMPHLPCDSLTPEPTKDAAVSDSSAHEGCSSLCSPRSSRRTAPVASFLNLLSVKRIAKERRQSAQVVPAGLTKGFNCKTLSALRPKLQHVFSSPFRTILCILSTYTLLGKKLNLSEWPITSNS